MKNVKFWSYLLVVVATIISCTKLENLNIAFDESKESSNIVPIETAKLELERIIEDVYGAPFTKTTASKRKVISSSYTFKNYINTRSGQLDSLIIYIFNFGNQDGFALMAGNKGLPSLLALAEQGEITESSQIDNPGFAVFAENMKKIHISENGFSDVGGGKYIYKIYGEWENIIYKEGGYCHVEWNQYYPYNMYCPLKDNEQTLTGCVATAVAQFMSIHKTPASYNGYTFDWDEMTSQKMAIDCSDESQQQIARLMKELGNPSNLDMTYNTPENGGSGANPKNIPRTLKNFGYSNGGKYTSYNTDEVVAELKEGYCVLVGGYSFETERSFLGISIKPKYTGGHRWLCHGLLERRRKVERYISDGTYVDSTIESVWYPLCNWGWGGFHNGYYLSNAFDSNSEPEYPTSTKNAETTNGTSGNYQYNTTVVIGIRK